MPGVKTGELYAGLDPAGRTDRPSGLALLDGGLRVIRLATGGPDAELEAFLEPHQERTRWVGLDGPVGVPRDLGRCCFEGARPQCACRQPEGLKGREAERAMSALGIGIYYLTKKAFARSWIQRSLNLADRLSRLGYQVLEVYPYGTKCRLWGRTLPPKETLQGRRILRTHLQELGLLLPESRLPSHHELDALVAAYTAWLHDRGGTECHGDPEEGAIVLPRLEIGALCLGPRPNVD